MSRANECTVEISSFHMTHPAENSGLLALCLCTEFVKCQSHTSLTRLSVQLPHTLPSRLSTLHMPKSCARPIIAIDSADSGVTASTLSVGCGF